MTESLQETAGLYVLDQLDEATRAVFEARLLREPELAAFVRELESGLARGIHSLPRHEPPAALLDQIEVRIAEPAMEARFHRLPAPARRNPWLTWSGWGLAAVIAVSLATLAIQSVRHAGAQPVFVVVGLDGSRNTFTELPQAAGARDPDARFIQLAVLADRYWRNPAALPVKLALPPGDSRGYAVFDPASRQGFIAIEQIPVLAENQRYHLWVADTSTGRVRDAGTLPLAGLNRGLYSFALDPADPVKSDRPQLFITAEDEGPAAPANEPRGKVVLGSRSL